MKLLRILLPIVTDNHEQTVKFYLKLTQSKISHEINNESYRISIIQDFLILSPGPSGDAMTIERKVNAIFIVDDLDFYWDLLKNTALQLLVTPQVIITGKRFVVEQPDGKIIEYLKLN